MTVQASSICCNYANNVATPTYSSSCGHVGSNSIFGGINGAVVTDERPPWYGLKRTDKSRTSGRYI